MRGGPRPVRACFRPAGVLWPFAGGQGPTALCPLLSPTPFVCRREPSLGLSGPLQRRGLAGKGGRSVYDAALGASQGTGDRQSTATSPRCRGLRPSALAASGLGSSSYDILVFSADLSVDKQCRESCSPSPRLTRISTPFAPHAVSPRVRVRVRVRERPSPAVVGPQPGCSHVTGVPP